MFLFEELENIEILALLIIVTDFACKIEICKWLFSVGEMCFKNNVYAWYSFITNRASRSLAKTGFETKLRSRTRMPKSEKIILIFFMVFHTCTQTEHSHIFNFLGHFLFFSHVSTGKRYILHCSV